MRIIMVAVAWLIAPLCVLLMALSMAVNSYVLFESVMVLGLLVVPLAAMWIVAMSFRWSGFVLEWMWTYRDTDVGPWSGWAAHGVAALALLALQFTIAVILFILMLLLPMEYPGGWR